MPLTCFDKSPVYILDAVRTAVGSPLKSLKDFSVGQLGSFVVAGLVKRGGQNPEMIDEVILGNAVTAGAGQNPARQASLLAGLLPMTTAYTVNNVCGAGLQSVILAGQSIVGGSLKCIIAGGAESASRTPQLFSKLLDTPYSEREPVDSLIFDGLWCSLSGEPMGEICEHLTRKEKISRLAQDQYALESHQKAAAANFRKEIIAVDLAGGTIFSNDERIRRHVSLESFKSLPASFAEKGTITAGNASVPSDGAAAVLIAGKDFVRGRGLQPLSRVLGYASCAVAPELTFTAAVPAAEACLKTCGLKLKDIDLFEIGESFAAQAIYTRDRLKILSDKMNVYGGDLALGHPLGAAGARILVTLVHALKRTNKKYGLAVICYGGGGAIAMIIANEKKNKMPTPANYFINNPIFVKFKKRFNFLKFQTISVLKSVNVNERIVEIPFALQALMSLPKGAKVLDLGCTESPLPLQLAALGYAVTGFDFREYPYRHPNLTFVQGDMTQLPFENENFDAILSISTLEHVGIGFYADPQEVLAADKKALAEMARVLKPGGIFILTAPYGLAGQNEQQRVYDEKSLAALLAPFQTDIIRYFKFSKPNVSECNMWIEISKEEAAKIASPQATQCVCLISANKK